MARPVRHKIDIERAALELFVEQGVDGTSIRNIATRAGVTEGALYRHYAGKDALVRALFHMHFEGLAASMNAAISDTSTAAAGIRAMIAAFYELYDRDSSSFEFILMTRHWILDEARSGPQNPVDVVAGVIASGIKQGEWPAQNVDLATEMCLGLVMEIPVGKRYGRLKGKTSKYVDDAWRAVLAVLRRDA